MRSTGSGHRRRALVAAAAMALASGLASLGTMGPAAAGQSPPSRLAASAATPGDWDMIAYNLQHTGENPTETTLSRSNVRRLTEKWSNNLGSYIDASPVLASRVSVNGHPRTLVITGTEEGTLRAVDATTGAAVWSRSLGWRLGGSWNPGCNDSPFGISGSPVIDRTTNRLYVVDGNNKLYALNLSTGTTIRRWPIALSQLNKYEHVWSGLEEFKGTLYVAMASQCDNGPYRGRIIAVDTSTAAISATWYPDGKGSLYGAGIWGYAGGSIDGGGHHMFVATGNSLGANDNAGAGDAVVELRLPSLTRVATSHPGVPNGDNDFGSTPVLYHAPGCPAQLVVENKIGTLYVYDQSNIAGGPAQSLRISNPSFDSLIGDAAYSAASNRIYVANSSAEGSYTNGMLAFRPVRAGNTCHLALSWQTTLGPNGSVLSPPTVANGVVYFGDGHGNTVDALSASTGALLWSRAMGAVFAAPIVIGGRLYAGAWDSKLYAFGLP